MRREKEWDERMVEERGEVKRGERRGGPANDKYQKAYLNK